MMDKKINIYANIPVRTVRPHIQGVIKNITMCDGDIHKLLCGKALVEEVLSDGTLLPLTFKNYNKVNDIGVKHNTDTVEEDTKVDKPADGIMNVPVSDTFVETETDKAPSNMDMPVAKDVDETTDGESVPDTKEITEEVKTKSTDSTSTRTYSKRR